MRRIVPGLVLAACWLLLLLKGDFTFFWFVVILMTLVAGVEYLNMAIKETRGITLALLTGVISLPVVMTGLWQGIGLNGGLFFSVFLSCLFVIFNYTKIEDGYNYLTRLILGIVYIGFLLAHLLLLWHLPEGNLWLVILAAVTAGSDSGAYYFGKQFGKYKLCRHISPNKTVEGALGGLFCGVVIAVLFALIILDGVNWLVLIPMAVLLTGVGIVGDLCESIIKRGTKTKDSGKILLGHGGILDRIDSMIIAAPVLYYLLRFAGS